MKLNLTLLFFILLNLQAYSQSKNNVSLLFGAVNNDVNIHGAIGDYGYTPKSGILYGLTYSRALNHSLAFETGVVYSNNKIQLNTDGPLSHTTDGNVHILSVPVILKYTFLKYLYADGGLLVENQTNNSIIRDQSGIGFELGLGGKYDAGRVTFFLNPFLREHAVIAFKSEGSSQNLLEGGLKLGLGYNF
ncbi:MAG TPA: hypothetical protein VHA56_15190 [Mucilaginibacter sp.]|nr:hypothetical protein [Mucilaginibacter sp.]